MRFGVFLLFRVLFLVARPRGRVLHDDRLLHGFQSFGACARVAHSAKTRTRYKNTSGNALLINKPEQDENGRTVIHTSCWFWSCGVSGATLGARACCRAWYGCGLSSTRLCPASTPDIGPVGNASRTGPWRSSPCPYCTCTVGKKRLNEFAIGLSGVKTEAAFFVVFFFFFFKSMERW